jgi:hypothetical protein
MKSVSFAGLGMAFQDQDACVIESQPIQDRSVERLSVNDRAIVAARAALLRAIADVQEGRDPPNVVRDPALNRQPNIVVVNDLIPSSTDWRSYLKTKADTDLQIVAGA